MVGEAQRKKWKQYYENYRSLKEEAKLIFINDFFQLVFFWLMQLIPDIFSPTQLMEQFNASTSWAWYKEGHNTPKPHLLNSIENNLSHKQKWQRHIMQNCIEWKE